MTFLFEKARNRVAARRLRPEGLLGRQAQPGGVEWTCQLQVPASYNLDQIEAENRKDAVPQTESSLARSVVRAGRRPFLQTVSIRATGSCWAISDPLPTLGRKSFVPFTRPIELFEISQ
jgi:hypothetical protein